MIKPLILKKDGKLVKVQADLGPPRKDIRLEARGFDVTFKNAKGDYTGTDPDKVVKGLIKGGALTKVVDHGGKFLEGGYYFCWPKRLMVTEAEGVTILVTIDKNILLPEQPLPVRVDVRTVEVPIQFGMLEAFIKSTTRMQLKVKKGARFAGTFYQEIK